MERFITQRSSDSQLQRPILSICISTWNRAAFLRAALGAIVPQLTPECEVLVVDNASTDSTADVVAEHAARCQYVRYIRQETNEGLDRNFDRAVELTRGEYCWLTSDDDLFKPGAVAAVLTALRQQPSLVLVNYEFRNASMSKVLQARVLDFECDRRYGPWELDRIFVELCDFVRYIGAVVIKRAVWLSRQRDLYNGSNYAFIGMLFQDRFPGFVHVIAQPYLSYRSVCDNINVPGFMELMLAKWPSLVASLPVSDAAKRRLHSGQPWRYLYELLCWRGCGFYCYEEYRRWIRPQVRGLREKWLAVLIAFVPRALANRGLAFYLSIRGDRMRRFQGFHLELLRANRGKRSSPLPPAQPSVVRA